METLAHRSVSLSAATLDSGTRRPNRPVAAWLLVCCALVFAIVVVGGVTRLTHSGLSITEWQPIVGTLPPLSDADWDAAFSKYRQTPEYLQVNKGMTLPEFQRIFWWEYFHRLLGRADRLCVSRAVPVVPRAQEDSAGPWRSPGRHLRSRRGAGRARLVHGEERPRRRPARVAIPPHGAPGARVPDLRGDVLDRAVVAGAASHAFSWRRIDGGVHALLVRRRRACRLPASSRPAAWSQASAPVSPTTRFR